MVPDLGIFSTLRKRAEGFAARHPALSRRILGLRPLYVVAGTPQPFPKPRPPVTVRLPAPPKPEIPVIVGPKIYTPARIAKVVCKHWEITENELYSARRPQNLARARFAAYAFCRDLTRLSLPQIGRALGKKDHTTVMHGLKRAGTLHAEDGDWRARYDAAAAELAQ